jgi:tetratricopeptide (TPR) repeat protein
MKQITKILYTALLATLLGSTAYAQRADRDLVRKGNRLYRDSAYVKAETSYVKAQEKNAAGYYATYNRGNALLRQNKPKEAMQQFEAASKMEASKTDKAKTWHNMGVIMQSQKQYADAINCYKEALRNEPTDNETRYNLALCQKLLKDQQQNQDQNKDKNDKNQQNKDQKDKDKNKDKNQDKQNEQDNKQDQKDKQKQQNQQPKQDPNKMSKENAEQILNAAMQDEKNTQKKMQRAVQGKKRVLEKDW